MLAGFYCEVAELEDLRLVAGSIAGRMVFTHQDVFAWRSGGCCDFATVCFVVFAHRHPAGLAQVLNQRRNCRGGAGGDVHGQRAGARHVESVGDASVHNRFTLWQGGLAMLADTPMGVGAGNSGRVYMDWYQPLTATEGYRTLVNSYLTFATEQGLVVFGGVLALFGIFWLVTGIVSDEARGARKHWFIIASQGALLAFLVAGFFSTTMESTVLWLPPLAAVALLAWVFLREEKDWPLIGRRALIGAGGALMAVLLVYGMGGYFQSQETLSRQFYFKGGELVSARLQQKQSSRVKSMAVWVDREVLGTEYGKPLRQILAQGLASEVEVFDANDGKDVDAQWLVYCGSRCRLARFDGNQRVVLIMPLDNFEMDSSRMKIITSSRVLERSSSKVLEKLNREGRVLALGGAEKNVLWYWDEILSSGIWD